LCVFLAWIVAAWFERVAHKYSRGLPRWVPVAIAIGCLFILTEDVIFALHTAGMPKSGIRTFVASQPLDPATLYVVVPDYMTATFVFYMRDSRVAYTAFTQTDHPEIFRFGTDGSHYSPRAVRDATVRLERTARAYRRLDLIVDDASDAQEIWQGVLYRSPARRLLDSMEARYPLVGQTRYPGRLEAVTVYRFRV
jgi:hypothetical protein